MCEVIAFSVAVSFIVMNTCFAGEAIALGQKLVTTYDLWFLVYGVISIVMAGLVLAASIAFNRNIFPNSFTVLYLMAFTGWNIYGQVIFYTCTETPKLDIFTFIVNWAFYGGIILTYCSCHLLDPRKRRRRPREARPPREAWRPVSDMSSSSIQSV